METRGARIEARRAEEAAMRAQEARRRHTGRDENPAAGEPTARAQIAARAARKRADAAEAAAEARCFAHGGRLDRAAQEAAKAKRLAREAVHPWLDGEGAEEAVEIALNADRCARAADRGRAAVAAAYAWDAMRAGTRGAMRARKIAEREAEQAEADAKRATA